MAAIWKRVEFAGCKLVTVSEGAIGELQIGFTGTMSAVFLKGLGEKTRRGEVGRVVAGSIPGGLCYGYETDVEVLANGEIDRGRRRTVSGQAETVRRIFAWRAEGAASASSSGSSTPRAPPARAAAHGGYRPSAGVGSAATASSTTSSTLAESCSTGSGSSATR